jgi:hypothetical protein
MFNKIAAVEGAFRDEKYEKCGNFSCRSLDDQILDVTGD